MALDVYVGPLTRYYSGDWENVAERSARGKGRSQARGGSVDRKKESDLVRPKVLDWRTALGRSLGDRISGPLDWDESANAVQFTGRPGWDGFGSLVLWAAYAEHPALRRPVVLPEEWDDDQALLRSNQENFRSRYSHLVRNVELWLPCNLEFTFEGEDVDKRRIVVGCVQMLASQLTDLNAVTWKARSGEVEAWGRAPPPAGAPLELLARHAFAVMSELAGQAVAHRLPMKLDY